METITERLTKLGFTAASNKVTKLKELKHKVMIACEHYRVITPEKIDNFNAKLKAETLKEDKNSYQYKQLGFTSLNNYEEVPPMLVLDELEKAQNLKCFDYFEVAKIEARVEVKDPIVFGRINGCPDRFFIAQWDDDVKIEQILAENEG